MRHTAENDAPSCQCVSLMDTSKCPVHGARTPPTWGASVRHCPTCACVTSPEVTVVESGSGQRVGTYREEYDIAPCLCGHDEGDHSNDRTCRMCMSRCVTPPAELENRGSPLPG